MERTIDDREDRTMLVNRRTRIAACIAATVGVFALAAALSPAANAELERVAGEAYGVDGRIEIFGDTPIVDDIEPTPAVLLPAAGSSSTIVETETNFSSAGVLTIEDMDVRTFGFLGNDDIAGQEGRALSSSVVDGFSLLPDQEFIDGIISATRVGSVCEHVEGESGSEVLYQDLEIAGVDVPSTVDPGTVYPVPGFGEVRLNVIQETAGRIEVAAMEIEFAIEDDAEEPVAEGSLRVGVSECGSEVLDVVNNQPIVPESNLADAFEGDPEFTG
jgi:hypothetical protein